MHINTFFKLQSATMSASFASKLATFQQQQMTIGKRSHVRTKLCTQRNEIT